MKFRIQRGQPRERRASRMKSPDVCAAIPCWPLSCTTPTTSPLLQALAFSAFGTIFDISLANTLCESSNAFTTTLWISRPSRRLVGDRRIIVWFSALPLAGDAPTLL